MKNLMLMIVVHFIIIEGIKISPKLDFGDHSELVQVKKEIKSGKIKGLRVTVDTSELKGFLFQNHFLVDLFNHPFNYLRIKKQWQ